MTNESTPKKRVLVVDDEPDFAALLQSILVEAGYTVATAYNCDDALSQVRKARPDVITLDIHMPRKSGVFFYGKLRANEKYWDIPVVVVTGVMQNDSEMANIVRTFLETEKSPPPDAYVDKPVNVACLLEAVHDALSSKTAGNC